MIKIQCLVLQAPIIQYHFFFKKFLLLTLLWVGSLGDSFDVGALKLPYPVWNSSELCQKLEIWYLSTHTYIVSENMPLGARPF